MIRPGMWVGVLIVTLAATPSRAFELDTHETLSQAAVLESRLNKDPQLLKDLGLEGVNEQLLPFNGSSQSIVTIIGKGARLEDTLTRFRPINHFFDPTRANATNNGAARGYASLLNPVSSPSWALEDRGNLDGQDNSFNDARRYLFQALTLSSKNDRETNFALMFQTLGMVGHHLQDMAQPQHVRNDLHCLDVLCRPFFVHNPSAYELYTNKKDVLDSLNLGGYPSVYTAPNLSTLSSARKLWFTGDDKGIAEFTNRNFVSDRTNFRYEGGSALPDRTYGFPIPLASNAAPIRIAQAYSKRGAVPQQIQQFCVNTDCWIEFFATSGTDELTGVAINNQKASSLSIFDHDLQLTSLQFPSSDGATTFSTQKAFSLNSLNFDAANEILLKRAVGYSAGLIDYFFRGKLHAVPQDPGTLLVKNLSTEEMSGDFSLHYDDVGGTRHPVTITTCRLGGVDVPMAQGKCSGATLVSVKTNADAGLTIVFQAPSLSPSDPALKPKIAGEYMLVFNGNMGAELRDEAKGMPGAVAASITREGTVSLLIDAALIPGINTTLLDPAHSDFGLVLPKDSTKLPDTFKAGGIVDGQYRGMIVNHAFREQHPAKYEFVANYLTPSGFILQPDVFRYFPNLNGGTFLVSGAQFQDSDPGEFTNTAWSLVWISGVNANAGANLGVTISRVSPFGYVLGSPDSFYSVTNFFSVGDDGVVGVALNGILFLGRDHATVFDLDDPIEFLPGKLVLYKPDGSTQDIIVAPGAAGLPARQGANHYVTTQARVSSTVNRLSLIGVNETVYSEEIPFVLYDGVNGLADSLGAKVALYTDRNGAKQRGFVVPYIVSDTATETNKFSLYIRSHLGTELVATSAHSFPYVVETQIAISPSGVPAIATSYFVPGISNPEQAVVKVWGGPTIDLGIAVGPVCAWTPDGRYLFVAGRGGTRVLSSSGELLHTEGGVPGTVETISGFFVSGSSTVEADGTVRGSYKMTAITRSDGVRDATFALVAVPGQPLSVTQTGFVVTVTLGFPRFSGHFR